MPRTFAVKQGSLTEGSELLLVNASNTNCALGSGVSGAIRRACGEGYQQHITRAMEQQFGGPMEPGQVLITDAGSHPRARYVAHVAVMDYRRAQLSAEAFPTVERIERCCHNLWHAVGALDREDSGSISVAMVALGAGTGSLGVRRPTEIACVALTAHLAATPTSRIGDVTFYGFELVEYVNIVDVVSDHFAIDPDTVPEEVRHYLSGKSPSR